MVPALCILRVSAGNMIDVCVSWWCDCSVSDHQRQRFTNAFSSPSVSLLDVKDNIFVLINSMAFEGDGCNMCLDAELRLQQISDSLRCAQVSFSSLW